MTKECILAFVKSRYGWRGDVRQLGGICGQWLMAGYWYKGVWVCKASGETWSDCFRQL